MIQTLGEIAVAILTGFIATVLLLVVLDAAFR
jgi:hypothetical protein